MRGTFANACPPPSNCGARIVPWRARPVPFWRHGFARPPETIPRLFVANVPARCSVLLGADGLVDEVRLDLDVEDAFASVTSFAFAPAASSSGAVVAAI